MPLKMQTTGRDDAEKTLQRRKAHTGSARTRQARTFAALQIFFKLTGQTVGARRYRLAQAFTVGR